MITWNDFEKIDIVPEQLPRQKRLRKQESQPISFG